MLGQAYSSVATAEVLVIDALGVMGEWYTIADVALVGGSLVDGIGGHNVMEPALLACVPIIGPFNQNGQHLIDGLREIDDSCIRQVATSAELAAAVLSVLQSAHQDGANTHSPLQNTVRLAAEQLAQRTRMRIVDVVHLAVLPNKTLSPIKP
jgi:3-deoxy-D-manno-octulosonic-acid transferase